MAEIVKARDTGRPGEPIIAVKRILPHLTDDRQFATMFLDESRVLAQLDHDNVIHTLEVGTVDETPYIALEYVFGQDARMLFHRARRNSTNIPIPIACYIISQVCAGLHYAHEKRDESGELLGLVHRDVSLQNVLLSYDGAVKLTDFGIAMSAKNVARTEAGIVKGKFGYMSPEQIKGEPMDRRSDIFATGICLYELLTTERLFSGESDYAAVEKVRSVDVVPPSQLNRLIPSELETIVMRALGRRPRDRFQSAHDMRRALLAFMVEAHNECSTSDLAAYMREVFAEDLRRRPTPDATLHDASPTRDEGTGLAAFDDLDPISVMSALNPEPEAIAEPRPATPAPRPRPGGNGRWRSEPPLGAPSVPPVIPRPSSIPPGADVAPEARSAPLSPFDEPPDEVGAGPAVRPVNDTLQDLSPYRAFDEQEADAEVTRQVHVNETYVGLDAPRSSDLPPNGDRDAPAPQRAALPRPSQPSPLGAPSPFDIVDEEPTVVRPEPLPDEDARGKRNPFAASAQRSYAMIAAIAVAIAAVSAAALYVARGPTHGTIHLTTVPRDAIVEVNGKRLPASASPFVINDLEPTVGHEINVKKEGYRGWTATLTVREGQTLELPLITLEPEAPRPTEATEQPEPPATQERAARTRREGAKARAKARSKARTPAKAAAERNAKRARASKAKTESKKPRPTHRTKSTKSAKSTSTPGKLGTLRLNSRPWSEVMVDGKRVGNTPQMNLRLSAGAHTIKLVNPEFGLRKTIKVRIAAGKTQTRIINLQ